MRICMYMRFELVLLFFTVEFWEDFPFYIFVSDGSMPPLQCMFRVVECPKLASNNVCHMRKLSGNQGIEMNAWDRLQRWSDDAIFRLSKSKGMNLFKHELSASQGTVYSTLIQKSLIRPHQVRHQARGELVAQQAICCLALANDGVMQFQVLDIDWAFWDMLGPYFSLPIPHTSTCDLLFFLCFFCFSYGEWRKLGKNRQLVWSVYFRMPFCFLGFSPDFFGFRGISSLT